MTLLSFIWSKNNNLLLGNLKKVDFYNSKKVSTFKWSGLLLEKVCQNFHLRQKRKSWKIYKRKRSEIKAFPQTLFLWSTFQNWREKIRVFGFPKIFNTKWIFAEHIFFNIKRHPCKNFVLRMASYQTYFKDNLGSVSMCILLGQKNKKCECIWMNWQKSEIWLPKAQEGKPWVGVQPIDISKRIVIQIFWNEVHFLHQLTMFLLSMDGTLSWAQHRVNIFYTEHVSLHIRVSLYKNQKKSLFLLWQWFTKHGQIRPTHRMHQKAIWPWFRK